MITFIQKLIILWEKKKMLTLFRLEGEFLTTFHSEAINRDVSKLRGNLGKLNMKPEKNRTSKENVEIIELNGQITESEKFISMVKNSKKSERELEFQIRLYKQKLFKK